MSSGVWEIPRGLTGLSHPPGLHYSELKSGPRQGAATQAGNKCLPVQQGGGQRAEGRAVRALGGLGTGVGGGEAGVEEAGLSQEAVTCPCAAAAGPPPLRGCPRTHQPSLLDGARHWA